MGGLLAASLLPRCIIIVRHAIAFLLFPPLDTAIGERGVSSPCFPLLDMSDGACRVSVVAFPYLG